LLKKWIEKLGKSKKETVGTTKPAAAKSVKPAPHSDLNSNKPASAKAKPPAPKAKPPHKAHTKAAQPAAAAWDISDFDVQAQEGKTRFHDLDLHVDLMRAIHKLGFDYCTPIQANTLPHTLKGLDIIGKAQTGTGKTAAFLITIIDQILNNPTEGQRYHAEPRALIIAPTRELVQQIAQDAKDLTKGTALHVVSIVGGESYDKQRKQLDDQYVDILVATPGRLIDFVDQKTVYLDQVEVLVLDEADRMLDMGFIPQVKQIVRNTPQKEHRQTLLFSATFTQDIINLSNQWTMDPVKVEIEPLHVATDTVNQIAYMVSDNEKMRVLQNILKQPDVGQTIIFANRRDQTLRLFNRLEKAGIKVGILSGEIAQGKRTKTLEDFKNGKIKTLIATDVVGRGIHIDGITHVINFNLPQEPENYVHRIGRTGRAGASGTAISLIGEEDAYEVPALEKLLGKKMTMELPPANLL
jgi:ATP-dependent RNA helicase RhlB